MKTIFDTYFKSLITQTQSLVAKLKAKDKNYHSSVNPISIYGELPINLQQNYNLIKLFEKEVDNNIEVIFINDESFIKAFIMKHQDKQNIYITKSNTCWTRFYVCKELAQMLIYSENNATYKLDDIDELLSSLMNGIDVNSSHQITADNITYLAAIEFLLPSDSVQKLLKMRKKGFSNAKIAKKMLVPENIVDFRLSVTGCDLFASIVEK